MGRFWRIEEPEDAPEIFTVDGRCESVFLKVHVHLPSGRLSVPLPLRRPKSDSIFAGSRTIKRRLTHSSANH